MNRDETLVAMDNLPVFELKPVCILVDDKHNRLPNNWQAVYQKDSDNKVVAFVSNRYKMVQHKTAFMSVLKDMDDYDCDMDAIDGAAIMNVFPNGEDFMIDEKTRLGVTAYNSVDRSTALNIKFVIVSNGRIFTIGQKNTIFKKAHVGEIAQNLKDYAMLVTELKSYWRSIITDLDLLVITTDEEMHDICKAFNVPEELEKQLKLAMGIDKMTAWGIIKMAYDHTVTKNFKSEVHKRKHLDELSENLFTWKFLSKLTTK